MSALSDLIKLPSPLSIPREQDFIFALLNDVYMKRAWDIVGGILALIGSLGIYSAYQFSKEAYATLVN